MRFVNILKISGCTLTPHLPGVRRPSTKATMLSMSNNTRTMSPIFLFLECTNPSTILPLSIHSNSMSQPNHHLLVDTFNTPTRPQLSLASSAPHKTSSGQGDHQPKHHPYVSPKPAHYSNYCPAHPWFNTDIQKAKSHTLLHNEVSLKPQEPIPEPANIPHRTKNPSHGSFSLQHSLYNPTAILTDSTASHCQVGHLIMSQQHSSLILMTLNPPHPPHAFQILNLCQHTDKAEKQVSSLPGFSPCAFFPSPPPPMIPADPQEGFSTTNLVKSLPVAAGKTYTAFPGVVLFVLIGNCSAFDLVLLLRMLPSVVIVFWGETDAACQIT